VGVGVGSRIVAQNNVWEAPATLPPAKLVRGWGGTVFMDSGSLLNGQPVDLLATLRTANPGKPLDAAVGWQPTLVPRMDPAADVPARVRTGAGAGRTGAHAD
jgi:pectate lyase